MLRFAPLPTGDMPISDLYVAIINYLVAQQRNEPFLVRIEDGDKARNIEGKDTEIMQILEKFALKHERVFHQSEHLHMHQTLAIRLLEEEKAFICTCKAETSDTNNTESQCSGNCLNLDKAERTKLKEGATPFVIRLKKPTHDMAYFDLIQGERTISPNEVDSPVILNTESMPTQIFASACDDMLSGVNFIIDKKEDLVHIPRQIHIKRQLGYEEECIYAELPALLTEENNRSVLWLFQQGFIPDAILNYLIVLSQPQTPKEIFTLPEAIEWFELEKISHDNKEFKLEELRSINRAHLRRMDDKLLSTLFGFADADVGKLAKLYLEEASTINELAEKIRPVFAPKPIEGKWAEQMKILQDLIFNAPMIEHFDAFISLLAKESGLEEKNLLTPLRLLLTGKEHGPELGDIYPLIKPYLLEVVSS